MNFDPGTNIHLMFSAEKVYSFWRDYVEKSEPKMSLCKSAILITVIWSVILLKDWKKLPESVFVYFKFKSLRIICLTFRKLWKTIEIFLFSVIFIQHLQ